jgi:excinuclease UvrABC helicase subunit UvrB
MLKNSIIILASTLMSLGLIIGGIGTITANFISPSGHLFEGIIALAIGVMLALMLVVADSVGQAIITFGEIFEKQVEIQEKIQEEHVRRSTGLGGWPLTNSNVSITDLGSGKTSQFKDKDEMMKFLQNIVTGKIQAPGSKSIEELEDDLAKAVSEEDFERAEKIRDKIRSLRDNDKKNDENL